MANAPTDVTVILKQNYSVDAFMDAYSISRNTFYAEVKAGNLKIFKYNRRTFVTRESAEDWLKKVVENGSKRILPSRRHKRLDEKLDDEI